MKKILLYCVLAALAFSVVYAVYGFCFRKSLSSDLTGGALVREIFVNNDCFACHATDAVRPFYASFPIIGDQVEVDIIRGTDFINFDEVDFSDIDEVSLAKIEQSVISGSMPLLKYKLIHWGTGFSSDEEQIISDWVRDVRAENFATGLAAVEFANEPIQPMVVSIATDSAKVDLGFRLFHDGRLSTDGTISCSTCHLLDAGGVDGTRTSEGIGGQFGGINAPTVYNAVFHKSQFWNGRATDLADQAAGPPENPIEMGVQTWDDIIERLSRDGDLVSEFRSMYAEGLTKGSVTDAIAEFEMTLITPHSPFDMYLRGDLGAISEDQKRGYALFKEYNCAACHVGQALGGQSFEKFGIAEPYFVARAIERSDLVYNDDDRGLFGFTGDSLDMHKFKVPTLRNIALTAPYLHDGSEETLEGAVDAMLRFQSGDTHEYSSGDVALIVDFMTTLTGNNVHM